MHVFFCNKFVKTNNLKAIFFMFLFDIIVKVVVCVVNLFKMNLENFLRKIGESNNTPTIAMCLIAVFKGLFRPIFTMMDKKSDPETKKYAAIREGLTEVAALPLYAITPFAAGKLAKTIASKIKGAEVAKMQNTAKFLGLGIATLLIPMVCNIIQPPIMNAYKRSQEAKKAMIAEKNQINQQNIVTPVKPAFSSKFNYGMRIGN